MILTLILSPSTNFRTQCSPNKCFQLYRPIKKRILTTVVSLYPLLHP